MSQRALLTFSTHGCFIHGTDWAAYGAKENPNFARIRQDAG